MTRLTIFTIVSFVCGFLISHYWSAYQWAEYDLIQAEGRFLTNIRRMDDLAAGKVEDIRQELSTHIDCDRFIAEQLLEDWPLLRTEGHLGVLAKADDYSGLCLKQLGLDGSPQSG